MKTEILKNLQQIEKIHDVKIILACESGSRAWGFPSKDSDYDVRFIYVHPVDWYLTIHEKRDVIELPIDTELDINGWDLRKSLRLLKKSNSPLLEWISSPIRYYFDEHAVNMITILSKIAFLPETSCHHYLAMARSSISGFPDHEHISLKKYMYALRTVLCCEWIIKYLNQPPMLMNDLLFELLPENKLRETIEQLVILKKENSEKFFVKRNTLIENFLHERLDTLNNCIPKNKTKLCIDEFNNVFRKILKR